MACAVCRVALETVCTLLHDLSGHRGLLLDRGGDGGGDLVHFADCGADIAHGVHRLRRGGADRDDLRADFLGSTRGLSGQRLHLARHHGEALASLAGACCLDRRVQRQQVGLAGDRGNQPNHVADAIRRLGELADLAVGHLVRPTVTRTASVARATCVLIWPVLPESRSAASVTAARLTRRRPLPARSAAPVPGYARPLQTCRSRAHAWCRRTGAARPSRRRPRCRNPACGDRSPPGGDPVCCAHASASVMAPVAPFRRSAGRPASRGPCGRPRRAGWCRGCPRPACRRQASPSPAPAGPATVVMSRLISHAASTADGQHQASDLAKLAKSGAVRRASMSS